MDYINTTYLAENYKKHLILDARVVDKIRDYIGELAMLQQITQDDTTHDVIVKALRWLRDGSILKKRFLTFPDGWYIAVHKEQPNQLKCSSCFAHSLMNLKQGSDEEVSALADRILFVHGPTFDGVKVEALTMMGHYEVVKTKIEPSKQSLEGITRELVQETFLNTLAVVIQDYAHLIPSEDIEDEDAYIFTAVPALALIRVLEASQDLTEGIRLIRGKVLTIENSPPLYLDLQLIQTLVELKGNIASFCKPQAKKQLDLLKYVCTKHQNPNAETSKELQERITTEITGLAAKINSVSLVINRMEVFQGKFREWVANCYLAVFDKNVG